MLAQNFKTAAELGIAEDEKSALAQVLGMLERGELVHCPLKSAPLVTSHRFNMGTWDGMLSGCGTVYCIGGWAEKLLGRVAFCNSPKSLDKLFFPDDYHNRIRQLDDITVTQAAIALRNYLTHGEPLWEEALRS